MSTVIEYKAGEVLFTEGQPSLNLYILKSGVVSIRKRKGAGYIELARSYAGEVIGEVSFFDRKMRSASVVAITEVRAIEISFVGLDNLYKQVPDYMRAVMMSLSDRLRKANETIRKLQDEVVGADEGLESQHDDSDTSAIIAATQPLNPEKVTAAIVAHNAALASQSATLGENEKKPDQES